jgi:hypothetical protein
MASNSNPEELGLWEAIRCSILGKPTDFYPRVKEGDGPIATLPTEELMKEFGIAADKWTSLEGGPKLEAAIGLARQSLNEVKAQTEYQDQKAGRLLTVATILSALAGILFQRFNDAYPLRATLESPHWWQKLILLGYVPFLLFVLAVLFGALVTFHATRTRFKYRLSDEKQRQGEKIAGDNGPNSRLFYTAILRARPRAWANAFVTTQTTGDESSIVVNPKLAQLYFRDLVGETYLVAAKTADKIRFLVEAQRLFAWALLFLLCWLFLFFVANFLPGTNPGPKPTQVRLVGAPAQSHEVQVKIVQQQPLNVSATLNPRAKEPPDAQGKKDRP